MALGRLEDGQPCLNRQNFPEGTLKESGATPIFEIHNPFPFRGTTYISKAWADARAEDPSGIGLPPPAPVSFSAVVNRWKGDAVAGPQHLARMLADLPQPLLVALAATSTDPEDLRCLADLCCAFDHNDKGMPTGLIYRSAGTDRLRPVVKNTELFETLVNNPHLPDRYKEVMVLRPGVQGGSEIVGDRQKGGDSHVFEYLRRNSYIPWGHYAANMAHDTIRYRLHDLTVSDMAGLRHLYYQRTCVRLADTLGVQLPEERKPLDREALEELRTVLLGVVKGRSAKEPLLFNTTLWGWNFGFDFAPSGYRLHASHQQIHQQFALIPETVATRCSTVPDIDTGAEMPAYGCGDLVDDFISAYREQSGASFFSDYIRAVHSNQRMDGRSDRESSLVIYQDDHVMLFVPKAQTSQWELQLVTLHPVGNILEADLTVRDALDRGILTAVRALAGLGARMITTIEYPKRFVGGSDDQHLLYVFLPKLPESPGAFSEAQLRWINGHYPEDFAAACRLELRRATTGE
jgi:hypothetical protein